MGCWNGTCGLGGLPLKEGTRVKAVIIKMEQKPADASGFSYMCDIARPVSYILSGVYNDCGGIELDSEDALEVKLLRDMLQFKAKSRRLIISGSSGNAEPFDYESIDFATISMEEFINEYIERDRVFIKEQGEQNIGIMFFSEDLVESLVDKGETGKRSQGLDELITLNIENEIDPFSFKNEHNWAYCQLTGTETVDYPSFMQSIRDLREFHREAPRIKEMFTDFLQLVDLMISLRKHWTPSGGKGSQSFSIKQGYRYAKALEAQVLSHIKVEECFCTKDSDEEYEVTEVEGGIITLESNSDKKVLTVKEFFENFLHEW